MKSAPEVLAPDGAQCLLAPNQVAGGRARLVDPQIIKRLSAVSTWRGLELILRQYLVIGTTALLHHIYFSWWTYPIAVVIIGSRFLAIATLIHDGTHWRLTRHRRLNDVLNELVLCLPFIESAERNRADHLAHHHYFRTEGDPERKLILGQVESRFAKSFRGFPKRPIVLFWMIAKDLLGLSLLDILYDFIQVRTRAEGVPHRPKFQRIKLACYASIALLLTWQSWWVAALLYWAVPVLTWYKCGVQLRALCNHFGMQETASPYSGTRTLITSWWERLLICPYYASHHLDHHLYPSVPCYNLWALHRELLEHSEYRQHAHITRGFWGLLKELADGPARYEVRPTF